MREIKFRAWEEDVKFMNDQVRITVNPFGANKTFFEVTDGFNWKEVNSKHVMQYTGLKDKKSLEIYEGDIDIDVDNGNLSVVKYLEKYGAYCFVPMELYLHGDYEKEVNYEYGYDCYFHNMVPSKYAEIIGNIYENPELLEQS